MNDDDDVPVADWELARHGKTKQPTRLVRRLRHIQYVILHRRGDRRLIRLIQAVQRVDQEMADRSSPTPTQPLVEFPPDQFSLPDPGDDPAPLFDTPQITTDADGRHWHNGHEWVAVTVDGETTFIPKADSEGTPDRG